MSAKQELHRRLDALAERQRQRDPELRPKVAIVRSTEGEDVDVDAEVRRQLGRDPRDGDLIIHMRVVPSGTERRTA